MPRLECPTYEKRNEENKIIRLHTSTTNNQTSLFRNVHKTVTNSYVRSFYQPLKFIHMFGQLCFIQRSIIGLEIFSYLVCPLDQQY